MVVTGANVVQADALDSDVVRRELPLLGARPALGRAFPDAQPRHARRLGRARRSERRDPALPRRRRRHRRAALAASASGACAPATSSSVRSPPRASPTSSSRRWNGRARRPMPAMRSRRSRSATATSPLRPPPVRFASTREGRIASLDLGLGGVESRPFAADVARFIGQSVDEALAHPAGRTRDPLPLRHAGSRGDRRLSRRARARS